MKKIDDISPIIESAIKRILGSADVPGHSGELKIILGSLKRKSIHVDFKDLEKFGTTLAGKYDDLTAKGLLIRIGREAFVIVRQNDPEISNLGSIKNRLKPINKRFNDSLKIAVDWFTEKFGFSFKNEEETIFTYRLQFSLKNAPIYYFPFFLFGFFEEFCHWLDARKDYRLIYNKAEKSIAGEIRIEISHPE